jgi:hypothetical protein
MNWSRGRNPSSGAISTRRLIKSSYSVLLDALNRHRGKGQQKVTVEHVHVHSGGQAVVGMVGAPGGGAGGRGYWRRPILQHVIVERQIANADSD